MKFEITPAATMARPDVSLPDPRIFEVLKEQGIRALISDHYDLLKDSSIKELFPRNIQGLTIAKKHSSDFFIQICGGPRYFDENRGAPRMVARHMPFKITPEARIVWLEKYQELLEKLELDEDLKVSFWNYIDIFSIWMINTPSSSTASSLHPKS